MLLTTKSDSDENGVEKRKEYHMKKKLLILGATTETIFMVKKAEEMGIETFVVELLPGSFSS